MDSFFAVVADINGDGKADTVMSNDCASDCSTGSVVALIGNGNGSFHAPGKFPLPSAVPFLASSAADLNGDGSLTSSWPVCAEMSTARIPLTARWMSC